MAAPSDFSIVILDSSHDRSRFDSGNEALTRYLISQATQDMRRDLAQTYVMIDTQHIVIGYYTLSANMIEHTNLPEALRKKLPRYPIPAVLVGRLAVDKRYQGQGLARKLLGDALRQAVAMSKTLGIHAVIVDEKNETVVEFYRKFGFLPLADSSLHLYLPIKTVKGAI